MKNSFKISLVITEKKYYIKKVWMPKAGDFGVKIKYTNSVAMDLSWIEDTN